MAWAARADDQATEQARQHYESGTRNYDLGRWDEAIADYEKAYELRPDPSFLYNLAQTCRRKGDAKRALELYKNYLRKDPSSPQREDVEEKIAALQKQVDEAATRPAVEPAAPSVAPVGSAYGGGESVTPPATQPPALLPGAASAQVAAPPGVPAVQGVGRPSNPGRALRIAGIVCGSVGAGAAIVGAIFGLRARSLSNRVTEADAFSRSDDSAGQRAETLQWAFYGIGAGALVTGGVLYYLGMPSSPVAPSISLGPLVGPDSAGVSAMGVF